jgi:hypothetical protein
MKRNLIIAIIAILITAAIVYAASVAEQTKNTIPQANSSFLTDLQTFLHYEEPQRYNDTLRPFALGGGTHSTGAGLTQTPDAFSGYANGFYTTETGAITYPDNSTCIIAADENIIGGVIASGGYTYSRVSGTHYLMNCAGSTTVPSGAVPLMTVVTSGGSVVSVTDIRTRTAVGVPQGGIGINSYTIGDLLYANTTSNLDVIHDIATGSVLLSGGVNTAPAYGKVGLTTHVSGTLSRANGGTGITCNPTNGQLLIGKTSDNSWNCATLTAGSGIQVTNAAGGITIANTTTSTGTWGSRGQKSTNDGTFPNTKFTLSASEVTLRNTSNAIVVQHAPSNVTCDVTTAGPTANGRDQAGDFSASSWVYFYWIWDSTHSTLACLASAVATPTGPTFPTSYDYWSYAGAVYYDSNPYLKKTRIYGQRACYETREAVATGANSTTEAAEDVSTYVPPGALDYQLSATARIGNNANSDLDIRIISSSNYMRLFENSTATGYAVANTIWVPNVGQQFYYIWGSSPAAGADFYISCYTIPNGG